MSFEVERENIGAGTTERNFVTNDVLGNTLLPEPTITFNDIDSYYGDADFNLEAKSNSIGTISYTIVEDNSTGTSLSGTNNETLNVGNVGSVIIRATQEAGDSFSSATQNIRLTINRRAITLTANEQEKNYGDDFFFLDETDFTILDKDGGEYRLPNGEVVTNVAMISRNGYAEQPFVGAGTYVDEIEISAIDGRGGGFLESNYDITLVAGDLIIRMQSYTQIPSFKMERVVISSGEIIEELNGNQHILDGDTKIVVYDSGGSTGGYSKDENIVVEFKNENKNFYIITIPDLSLEYEFDSLTITEVDNDGNDVLLFDSSYQIIATLQLSEGTGIRTNSSFKFQFTSDSSTNGTGFRIEINPETPEYQQKFKMEKPGFLLFPSVVTYILDNEYTLDTDTTVVYYSTSNQYVSENIAVKFKQYFTPPRDCFIITILDLFVEAEFDFLTITEVDSDGNDGMVLFNSNPERNDVGGNRFVIGEGTAIRTCSNFRVQFDSNSLLLNPPESGFKIEIKPETLDYPPKFKIEKSSSSSTFVTYILADQYTLDGDTKIVVYDSGGSTGPYTNNEDIDVVFKNEHKNFYIITILDLDVEAGLDFLTITEVDTEAAAYQLFSINVGGNSPFVIGEGTGIRTNSSFKVQFKSDLNPSARSGFKIEIKPETLDSPKFKIEKSYEDVPVTYILADQYTLDMDKTVVYYSCGSTDKYTNDEDIAVEFKNEHNNFYIITIPELFVEAEFDFLTITEVHDNGVDGLVLFNSNPERNNVGGNLFVPGEGTGIRTDSNFKVRFGSDRVLNTGNGQCGGNEDGFKIEIKPETINPKFKIEKPYDDGNFVTYILADQYTLDMGTTVVYGNYSFDENTNNEDIAVEFKNEQVAPNNFYIINISELFVEANDDFLTITEVDDYGEEGKVLFNSNPDPNNVGRNLFVLGEGTGIRTNSNFRVRFKSEADLNTGNSDGLKIEITLETTATLATRLDEADEEITGLKHTTATLDTKFGKADDEIKDTTTKLKTQLDKADEEIKVLKHTTATLNTLLEEADEKITGLADTTRSNQRTNKRNMSIIGSILAWLSLRTYKTYK